MTMTGSVRLMALGAILALGACGETNKAEAPKAQTPRTLPAGEYEVTSEVTKLASADKSTPATKLKQGDKATTRGCVDDKGVPDMALFVEAGDQCTVMNSFARAGRLSIQYECQRAGRGKIYPNLDGNTTADGFKAMVNAASSFPGDGDYQLRIDMVGKRVGNCPAPGAANG
jgi:hypothetical protein